jgi:hypothetical protein
MPFHDGEEYYVVPKSRIRKTHAVFGRVPGSVTELLAEFFEGAVAAEPGLLPESGGFGVPDSEILGTAASGVIMGMQPCETLSGAPAYEYVLLDLECSAKTATGSMRTFHVPMSVENSPE